MNFIHFQLTVAACKYVGAISGRRKVRQSLSNSARRSFRWQMATDGAIAHDFHQWLVASSCSFPPSPATTVPSWQYFWLLLPCTGQSRSSSIFWNTSLQVAFFFKSCSVKSASARYLEVNVFLQVQTFKVSTCLPSRSHTTRLPSRSQGLLKLSR